MARSRRFWVSHLARWAFFCPLILLRANRRSIWCTRLRPKLLIAHGSAVRPTMTGACMLLKLISNWSRLPMPWTTLAFIAELTRILRTLISMPMANLSRAESLTESWSARRPAVPPTHFRVAAQWYIPRFHAHCWRQSAPDRFRFGRSFSPSRPKSRCAFRTNRAARMQSFQ